MVRSHVHLYRSGIAGVAYIMFAAIVLTSTALAETATPASANAPAAAEAPSVPGDIFGFTDAASIDEPGKHGAGVTIDGAFGKRDGSYSALSTKYSYERVIADRTKLEIAAFTVWHSIANVTAIPINRQAIQFNGAGFELSYALAPRTIDNPFSVKIAVEPRWSRIDGDGRRAGAYGSEFKLAVDAPVINDNLFWAANAVLGMERARVAATTTWETGSSLKFSTALAAAITQTLFFGAEATYVRSYDGILGKFAGHAVFLGPTIMVKLGTNAALSATFAPQLAGNSKGTPRQSLDLDSASRYNARLKLGVEF